MNSIDLIKQHEGCRLNPYMDTLGVLTVGYGRNLEKPITQACADRMLQEDMATVYADCLKFDWYEGLSEVRQAVIENMMYNLGYPRFSKFKKTINYISEGDFKSASDEMLDSRWAKQVGNRANQLSQMMKTNEWI